MAECSRTDHFSAAPKEMRQTLEEHRCPYTLNKHPNSPFSVLGDDDDHKVEKITGPLPSPLIALNRKRPAFVLAEDGSDMLDDYREEVLTTTNDLEDYKKLPTLDNNSNSGMPPAAKKLCSGTGIQSKVLTINGSAFLLPVDRGDVMVFKQNSESVRQRSGISPCPCLHPKVLIIDGKMFILPHGGGELVPWGPVEPNHGQMELAGEHEHVSKQVEEVNNVSEPDEELESEQAQEVESEQAKDHDLEQEEDINFELYFEEEVNYDEEETLESETEEDHEPEQAFGVEEQPGCVAKVQAWIDRYFVRLENLEKAELERQELEGQELEAQQLAQAQADYNATMIQQIQQISEDQILGPGAPVVPAMAPSTGQPVYEMASPTTGSTVEPYEIITTDADRSEPSEDSGYNDYMNPADQDDDDDDDASWNTDDLIDAENRAEAMMTRAHLQALQVQLPGFDINSMDITGANRFGITGLPDGHISGVIQIVTAGELWGINIG